MSLLSPFARTLLGALALAACSSHTRVPYTVLSGPRDWATHPAVVEIDPAPDTIYAVSDVHGGYDRLVALLARHGVIAAAPSSPGLAKWSAGHAVLVVAGDIFDKGPAPLEAVDFLRALEGDASSAGGRVVVTLGNHEGEFLYDPQNDKATKDDGVDQEIHARGLDPLAFANGSDPHGQWLRNLPFAVRVGRWFFSHAGDTHGRSVSALETALRSAVDAHNYDDPEVTGAGSILESREWYTGDAGIGLRYAHAAGAEHIVFGHQPDALGPKGSIAVGQSGALFRIDCGMSPDVNDSEGKMLRARSDGAIDIAESLAPDGTAQELWRGQ
jgi:hypothetical protein